MKMGQGGFREPSPDTRGQETPAEAEKRVKGMIMAEGIGTNKENAKIVIIRSDKPAGGTYEPLEGTYLGCSETGVKIHIFVDEELAFTQIKTISKKK